jgi:inner membrane transporter RhtA
MERVAVHDGQADQAIDRAADGGPPAPPGAPAPAAAGDAAPAPVPVLDRVPPVGLVLTATASVQFGAAIAAKIFDRVGPAGASLLRLVFAAALLLAVWRPRPRAHTAADLRLAGLFGVVLGLMNLSFYEGLARLPLGVAVTIEFIGPLGVAIAGSRRRLDLVWALLAAVAIVLLAKPGGGGIDALGVAFTLFAAACWAAYILLATRVGRRFARGSGLSMAMVVATAVVLVPGVVGGGGHILHPSILAIGFVVAMLSSVIPYSLETEALRRMPPHVFGVLMSLEPAVAALAGFLILGERLDAQQFAAIGMVVVASTGATRSTSAPPPADA